MPQKDLDHAEAAADTLLSGDLASPPEMGRLAARDSARKDAHVVGLPKREARIASGKFMVPGKKPCVVVVERTLLHYRVACYERLRARLNARGIELKLLTGDGTREEMMKKDQVKLPWATHIPTHYLLGGKICWQPFGEYARDADLVIVMHENKLLYNLWLLSFGRPRRIAFWGHGRNMQSANPNGLKERFKRWTVDKVDWWFAYTEESADLVSRAGFSRERTTVVENAIDTRELIALCERVRRGNPQALREELGLQDGPVGLYLGSLYREKRIDFMIEAAKSVRSRIPAFQLLVVGAGPQQGTVEAAAAENGWIRYLGPLQGLDKAKALVASDVMLNPGLVGLGVLDSFVGGAPMFTTDCGLHSPEIAYLTSGRNGMITNDNLEDYTGALVAILRDPERLENLQREAKAMASRYTIENMASRICDGIVACLENI